MKKKTNRQLQSAEIIDFVQELPQYHRFVRVNQYIKYGFYAAGVILFVIIFAAVAGIPSKFARSIILFFTAIVLFAACGFLPKYIIILRMKLFVDEMYDCIKQQFGDVKLDSDFEEDLWQDMID